MKSKRSIKAHNKASVSFTMLRSLSPKNFINHKKFQIFDVNDKDKVLSKLNLIKSVDTKMEFLDFVAYVREEKKEELEFQKIRENERLLRKFIFNVRDSIQQRKLSQFNAHFSSGIKVFAEMVKDKRTTSHTNIPDQRKRNGVFGVVEKDTKNKAFLVRKFANILKQSRTDTVRSKT